MSSIQLDKEACSICLETMHKEDDKTVETVCHHLFHDSCLNKWLEENNTCPMCRNEIVSRAEATASSEEESATEHSDAPRRAPRLVAPPSGNPFLVRPRPVGPPAVASLTGLGGRISYHGAAW